MKNLIYFKSILVYSLCLAGPLLLGSACTENKTTDTTDSIEVARQENIHELAADNETFVVIENDNDNEFLMKATEMQMDIINLGKLAQQKGNSAHVKELGKMLEEDYTKFQNEIKSLAQSKSVSIPTSLTDDSRDAYEELNDETGNDFGKSYSKMMVDQHEDAIELFEEASTDSEDPEIRAWASEKLPTLRTHLVYAKECKEKCDNMKS